MWHLKTKVGVFWIVPKLEAKDFILGIDDDELGHYDSLDAALDKVLSQSTGHLDWDQEVRIKAPANIQGWQQGQPGNWLNS